MGCTHTPIENKEVTGIWFNEDGSYMRIDSNGQLIGYRIPRRLLPGMEPIKSRASTFTGRWDIDNRQHQIRMYVNSSATEKRFYSCPLYIGRNGLFESGDISYLYLLDDVDTDKRYILYKNKSLD